MRRESASWKVTVRAAMVRIAAPARAGGGSPRPGRGAQRPPCYGQAGREKTSVVLEQDGELGVYRPEGLLAAGLAELAEGNVSAEVAKRVEQVGEPGLLVNREGALIERLSLRVGRASPVVDS